MADVVNKEMMNVLKKKIRMLLKLLDSDYSNFEW